MFSRLGQCSRRVFAQAFAVEPVVRTSSMMMAEEYLGVSWVKVKASSRFLRRFSRESEVWVSVFFLRFRGCAKGMRVSSERARPILSDWLKERFIFLRQWRGTETRTGEGSSLSSGRWLMRAAMGFARIGARCSWCLYLRS